MLNVAVEIELGDLYVGNRWEELAQRPEIVDHPDWAHSLATAGEKSVRKALASCTVVSC